MCASKISSDQWQWLNRLYSRVSRFRLDGDADMQLPAFLASIYEGVHLFQGVTDSTMSHGEGWHFIQMGRYLERASATVEACWKRTTASSGAWQIARPRAAISWNGSDYFARARLSKLIAKCTPPI